VKIGHVGGLERWRKAVAVLGLAALAFAALAQTAAAQDRPSVPHWFWGRGYHSDNGATVRFVDPDGVVVPGVITTVVNGEWALTPSQSQTNTGRIEIIGSSGTRTTELLTLKLGGQQQITADQFTATSDGGTTDSGTTDSGTGAGAGSSTGSDSGTSGGATTSTPVDTSGGTVEMRIRARTAPDGRLEFGVQVRGQEMQFPSRRYFPRTIADNLINQWFESSVITLAEGFTGKIIARRLPSGGTEFGYRVEGRDDYLPRLNTFPAVYPTHNRWLSSHTTSVTWLMIEPPR